MTINSCSRLRHIVLFQFKDDTSLETVQRLEQAFIKLKEKIPFIQAFEWGHNVSPEGLNQGFTHCFLVTFKNEEDRDAYLPHESHQAFVSELSPHLLKACVLDYWTEE